MDTAKGAVDVASVLVAPFLGTLVVSVFVVVFIVTIAAIGGCSHSSGRRTTLPTDTAVDTLARSFAGEVAVVRLVVVVVVVLLSSHISLELSL